ncbi:MAG: helix-turn-helix transcriptional regulator [Firmicutes bacterium]|nr:helix-turn-helix transcriptional regulator [Bacillota bacterium]MBE3590862.1 helix-turn-helix transcriptional regulator [Bacillota bacterium]
MTELRLARTLKGISQAEAARAANIDRSTLSRYEATGKAPIEVLQVLARLYDAPQLLLGHSTPAFGDTPSEAVAWLLEELEEARDAARRLDEDIRHGRQIRVDDMGQVYDVYTAIGALLVSLAGRVDLDQVRRLHERKLAKYGLKAVA